MLDASSQLIEKMAAAFRSNPWRSAVAGHPSEHVSVIRYFGQPILPCRVTDDERTGLKLMQTEAASRERQRAPLLGGQKKQHVSTGVSPAQNMRPDATAALDRPTNATSPRSMVDLSTTPTRASVAAARRTKLFEAGGFSSDASARAARAPPPLAEQQQQQQQHFPPSMLDGSSDVLPATPGSASRRIRLRTALEQPEPEAFARTAPLSPSHRPVKMQYPVANEELHQMPLPPRDMYPAIQLHLGLASAENDADAAAAAAAPRRHRTEQESKILAARGMMSSLPAAIKGYIARLLMGTDRVRNLIRTIHDTEGIILEFAHEGVGTLNYTDRGFLRRAQSQLASAKTELLGLFREGAGPERARVMAQHREQEMEKMFRTSIDTYDGVNAAAQQGEKEGARLLSEATRKQILRRNMGKDLGIVGVSAPSSATTPAGVASATDAPSSAARGGSPMMSRRALPGNPSSTASSAVHRSAPEMSSPKHTDFLRRKTGSSASGKHADAYSSAGGSANISINVSSSVGSHPVGSAVPKKSSTAKKANSSAAAATAAQSQVAKSADELLSEMAAAVERELSAAEGAAAGAAALTPPLRAAGSKIPLPKGASPPAASGGGGMGTTRRHTYTLDEPPEMHDNGVPQAADAVFMG